MSACAAPLVHAVVGTRFAASPRGRRLLSTRRLWFAVVEQALSELLELVPRSRLVQVYRAPLRVGRQVPPAAYELYAGARLVDVVRRLELNVRTQGNRRADLRAAFLSRTFHVEVKSHEDRSGAGRRGGVRAARALARAALPQMAAETPNLLVLGRLRREAVAHSVAELAAEGAVSAIVWLDLQPRRRNARCALFEVPGARHPFTPALLDVLRQRFTLP